MPRKLPPLNGLRAFEAAGRLLSFARAADELNVTPAAISHQVKALEEYLGVALFRRLHRGLLLTDAGQACLPGLSESFDGLAAAVGRLRQLEARGGLTVSAPPGFAAKWLVIRLERFRDICPDIDVRISASMHLVDFTREDVDIAVRYGAGNYPGLRVEWLLSEEMYPVCSPALLSGPKPLKTPDDLRHHTLVHDESPTADVAIPDWRMWLHAAGIRDIDTTRSLRLNPTSMAIQATIDGLGVALGRSVLVENDIAAGRLVRPFEMTSPLDFHYYIVATEAAWDLPKVKAFREFLMAEATADA